MDLHGRVDALLRTPSWTTLDADVVARGRALVVQRLAAGDDEELRAMLS